MPVEEPAAFPPQLETLRRASEGDQAALAEVRLDHPRHVETVLAEGRSAYGDLGLDEVAATAGLARIITAVATAEIASVPDAPPTVDQICGVLVMRDVYLSEALLRGVSTAWLRFEEVIEVAFRSVRSHFSGQTPQVVLDEIRESVLGTFFIDGKIATFRATAPLGAWARQVVFNIFRQRMNKRRSGREATSLSQLADQESEDHAQLLPPSREPPPDEVAHLAEWGVALERAVPEALESLDRDERRMLEMLPTKRMTQVDLARELDVSPFKLNRWYKEVRQRFLRSVTHRLRMLIGLDEDESHRLVDYLVGLWCEEVLSDQDLPQSPDEGAS